MRRVDLTTWLGFAALILVLDQISKYVVIQMLDVGERIPVLPIFSWIHLRNEGAAFSLLSGAGGWQRWMFVAVAVGFTVYLIYEMLHLRTGQKLYGWVYGLILGGAWGNLYDRVLDGHVVDFVLVHYQQHYFPAFNVADSAISVGAVAWIALMMRDSRRARLTEADADSG